MSEIVLTFLVLLGPCLFFIVFGLMWLGMSALFAFLGGWATLAKHYPRPAGVAGVVLWSWQSASFGIVRYRQTLKIGANEQGLHLAQLFVFEFSHPPLFIPWEDIAGLEKPAPFFNGVLNLEPVVELRFAKAPGQPCYLRRPLVDKLEQISGGRWQYQRALRPGQLGQRRSA